MITKASLGNPTWSTVQILGSGLLEFGEFCQLAAKFLVEEDEEGLKKELKEAFRIYDKEGNVMTTLVSTKLY